MSLSIQQTEQKSNNEGVHIIDTNFMDVAEVERLLKSLASTQRLEILRQLHGRNLSITQLAEKLDIPSTTVTMHINILEKAGLIRTELKPASRGRQKICSGATFKQVILHLPHRTKISRESYQISMPVGAYMDCFILPTCGLVGDYDYIGEIDDPSTYFNPARVNARLLWFKQGYVEYRFPSQPQRVIGLESIQFSLEVCSEAPNSAEDWPSDITVWVNGVEVGTWTSPSDFGGERGLYNPDWWPDNNSQFGILKTWCITNHATYIDGKQISDINIRDLNLNQRHDISMRIGIHEDADHVGGVNIFGNGFGNYPQDIVMRLNYVSDGD